MIPKAKKKNYVDNAEFYKALVAYKIKVDAAKLAHEAIIEEWKLSCTPILKKLKKENAPLFVQFTEDKIERESEGEWPRDITVHYGLPKEPKYNAPRIPEYIGKCIWLIAEGLSNYWKFCRYSYRDEMAADGIEDCILRIQSFDPGRKKKEQERLQRECEYRVKNFNSDKPEYVQVSKKQPNGKFEDEDILVPNKEALIEFYTAKIKSVPEANPFSYFTQICYFAAVRRIKKEKKQKDVKSALVKNSNILEQLTHTTQTGDDAEYHNSYLTFLLENVDNASMTEEEKEESQRTYKKTTKAHQKFLKDKEIELNTDGVNKNYVEESESEEVAESSNVLDFGLDEE